MNLIFKPAVISILLAGLAVGRSWAQPAPGQGAPGGQPGPCRADVSHYCEGAREIGPMDVHKCLAAHVKDISMPCREHLIEEGDAAPEITGNAPSMMFCQPDQARFCPETPLAQQTEAAYECLSRHLKDLGPGCRSQVQAARERLQQTALAKVAQDCKDEAARFCGSVGSKGFKLLDCLLDKKVKSGLACSAAVAAAKSYRKRRKTKPKSVNKS